MNLTYSFDKIFNVSNQIFIRSKTFGVTPIYFEYTYEDTDLAESLLKKICSFFGEVPDVGRTKFRIVKYQVSILKT